jgi:hypothetical protein
MRRLLLILPLCLVAGCGYTIGGNYRTELRTVEVPIFQSESDRRGVEFQLTEAVQKQVKLRTPFRLAKAPYADTRLTGRIVSVDKRLIGLSGTDEGRELQYSVAVQVTWEDLNTGRILAQENVPIEPDMIHLVSDAEFAPEVGQSMATGEQQALDRLARRIVELMEVPW